MSYYRMPRNGESCRTKSYKFTVSSKRDESLIALRKNIASINESVRKRVREYGKVSDYDMLYTVRLMGRGPRRWHTKFKGAMIKYFKGHYMAKPNAELLHPNADSNLQHRFAEEFDVYVHKDTDALSSLCVEIDTGQTPGTQSKIRKLQQQIWQLQISARSGRKVYV